MNTLLERTSGSVSWHENIVGREAEIERLSAALQGAAQGRGALWLLTGEAGIGKTRLAEEAARLAREAGFVCAWGRSWESGGAPAYWPWTQVMRSLRRAMKHATAQPTPDALSMPALLSTHAGDPQDRAAIDRFELFDSVTAWLADASEIQPLWIGLEDLHAADPASLALLEALLAPLRTSRILVVGTLRDVAASPDFASSVLQRIARQSRGISVSRLDERASRTLLAHALATPTEDLVQAALEATVGHPLFLVELIRAAHAGLPASELISASVHGVLRHRLTGLSETSLRVLTRAACMGSDIDRDALAQMFDEATVDAAIVEATREALLRPVTLRSWQFSHNMLRDVLVEALEPAASCAAHAEIADVLSANGAPAARLAHHLHHAGPAHLDRALDASCQAAQQALDRFAFEGALGHVAMARTKIISGEHAGLRARLSMIEGLSLLGLGRGEEGRGACLQATEIARAAGASDVFAEAALAYGSVYRFAMVDSKLVDLLEQALDLLPSGDAPLRAQLLARLAAARQPDPVPARPIALAREAITMAERLNDVDAQVAVLRAACSALVDLAPSIERRALDQRHLDLALRLGLHTDALTARQRLAFDCMELGAVAEANLHLAQAAELAQAAAHPRNRWRVPALKALRQLWAGELAETGVLIDEVRDLGRVCGDPNAQACHAYQLARWVELTGRWEKTEAAVDALTELATGGELTELLAATSRARFLLHIGRTAEGLAALDRQRAVRMLELGDRTAVQGIAAWAAATGDAELGRALVQRLRPEVDESPDHPFLSDGVMGFCWRAPVAAALADAARAQGDVDEALRWAQAAAHAAERHGGWPIAVEMHTIICGLAEQSKRGEVANEAHVRAEALISQHGLKGLAWRLGGSRGPGAARESELPTSGRRSTVSGPASVAPSAAEPPTVPELVDEGDVYCIHWRGKSMRVKATKGLAVLAHLVARPGVAVHVLDLAHLDGSSLPVDRGDGGELLDVQARAAYKARALEVRQALEEAEAHHDLGRQEKLRAELDSLADALSQGTALGGRSRRAPSAEERARQALRKQIRTGLDRIAQVDPELAKYLQRAVRTGRTCMFDP